MSWGLYSRKVAIGCFLSLKREKVAVFGSTPANGRALHLLCEQCDARSLEWKVPAPSLEGAPDFPGLLRSSRQPGVPPCVLFGVPACRRFQPPAVSPVDSVRSARHVTHGLRVPMCSASSPPRLESVNSLGQRGALYVVAFTVYIGWLQATVLKLLKIPAVSLKSVLCWNFFLMPCISWKFVFYG